MPGRLPLLFLMLPLLLLRTASTARADEATVLADIEAFFQTSDEARREEIARRIESDPAYDRRKVNAWLHRADLFAPLEPGRRQIRVPIGDGGTLHVTLRIPQGYDHARPYPLLYVLHGLGGNGDAMLRYIEHLLGPRVEQYIVAAPTSYRHDRMHSTTPPSDEHLAVLRAVKKTAHVDSDRVFVIGYSRGGHAAWTLAMLHADQFAGLIPVAGTLILPGYERLFETFLPNIAHTHVFACWGANDTVSADGLTPSEAGGIAGLNRQLCQLGAELELPLTWFECPDKGHGEIDVPLEEVHKMLTARREHYPRSVRHVFRVLHQGQAYWLEAHAWRGPWWDQQPLKLRYRKGENPDDPDIQREAAARAVRARLGELRGEIEGQQITVYRKKISELTVWISDGMIDWDQPVSLKVNGRDAFTGKLEPDLFVCLTQTARTYDFERLRWAGLRFKSGSKTRVVTGRTVASPR